MAVAIPNTSSRAILSVVFFIGLAVIFLSGGWHRARGFDKLILFNPLFYAMPLVAFGIEQLTLSPPADATKRRKSQKSQ